MFFPAVQRTVHVFGLASDFPDVNNRSGMCKPPDNTDYPHQERGVRNQANPALYSVLLKHSFYFRYHQQLFVYPTAAQDFVSLKLTSVQ